MFDGALLTMRYFFDVLDTELWDAQCFRGLDFEGDAEKHPEFLEQCRQAGAGLVRAIRAAS